PPTHRQLPQLSSRTWSHGGSPVTSLNSRSFGKPPDTYMIPDSPCWCLCEFALGMNLNNPIERFEERLGSLGHLPSRAQLGAPEWESRVRDLGRSVLIGDGRRQGVVLPCAPWF